MGPSRVVCPSRFLLVPKESLGMVGYPQPQIVTLSHYSGCQLKVELGVTMDYVLSCSCLVDKKNFDKLVVLGQFLHETDRKS